MASIIGVAKFEWNEWKGERRHKGTTGESNWATKLAGGKAGMLRFEAVGSSRLSGQTPDRNAL